MKGIIVNERNRILLSGLSNENCPDHHYSSFPHECITTKDGPIENILISK